MTRRFSFDGEWFEVAQADVPPVSSHPLVSLVLTAFQRSAQLPATLRSLQQQTYRNLEILVVEADHDGGKTEELCQRFGVGYLRRWNKADRRTAVTNNIGIRAARGEIVIVQSAECRHESADTVELLIAPIIEDPSVSTFPRVLDLNENGAAFAWKFHPDMHPHCFITFCQAFARQAAVAIGAFDEEYVGWGFEDNDFNFRLQFSGVQCRHVPAVVAHQWHPSLATAEPSQRADYYARRLAGIKAGTDTVQANVGKEWGDPRS